MCVLTHFLLHSTVQHSRWAHDSVVTLVQVMVLGRVKVCQDKHRLKDGVLRLCELLYSVCAHARRVDVLGRRLTVNQDVTPNQNHTRVGMKHVSDAGALLVSLSVYFKLQSTQKRVRKDSSLQFNVKTAEILNQSRPQFLELNQFLISKRWN